MKTKVLIEHDRILARIKELGEEINKMYAGQTLTLVPVMDGALVFCAHLMQQLKGDVEIRPIKVSSYVGTSSTGTLVYHSAVPNLKGKHILLVDDILDTGHTIKQLAADLLHFDPLSIRACCAFSKDKVKLPADNFIGFSIPDVFVVGFGLDFNGLYRNLPDLCQMVKDEIMKQRNVGKIREKLAELLTRLAREKWGPEYECWPEDLHRNAPAYISVAQDGVSWDGYVRRLGDIHKGKHVHSWQNMVECLKGPKHILCDDGELMAGT